jgi:hypothetical protein
MATTTGDDRQSSRRESAAGADLRAARPCNVLQEIAQRAPLRVPRRAGIRRGIDVAVWRIAW